MLWWKWGQTPTVSSPDQAISVEIECVSRLRNLFSAQPASAGATSCSRFVMLTLVPLAFLNLQFPTSPKPSLSCTRNMRRSCRCSFPTIERRTANCGRRWVNWLHNNANGWIKIVSDCSDRLANRACSTLGRRSCRRSRPIRNQQVNCRICCRSK